MNILSVFSERLRELMSEAQISVLELSPQVKMSKSSLYRAINAQSIPQLPRIIALADYFQCPTDYLFSLSEGSEGTTFKKFISFSESFKKVLKERSCSLYRLSKDLHIGEGLMEKWLQGSIPQIDNLLRIAQYFDCSLDHLLGREN